MSLDFDLYLYQVSVLCLVNPKLCCFGSLILCKHLGLPDKTKRHEGALSWRSLGGLEMAVTEVHRTKAGHTITAPVKRRGHVLIALQSDTRYVQGRMFAFFIDEVTPYGENSCA